MELRAQGREAVRYCSSEPRPADGAKGAGVGQDDRKVFTKSEIMEGSKYNTESGKRTRPFAVILKYSEECQRCKASQLELIHGG